MATVDQIVEVREYIGEDDETGGWSDDRIAAYVDREENLLLAASAIWSAKAARYASLVNVSESGSSRSLGSLIDNALKMAASYRTRGGGDAATATEGAIILTRLTRK